MQIVNPPERIVSHPSRQIGSKTGMQVFAELKKFGKRVKRKISREFHSREDRFEGWSQ
ncbi:MAG: hypothetical protein KF824_05495 [Fimbriimonadaceae bacterium]|nr:MAG: hypothetical protein KF824_05495 [Fimbriimonadaceae bacterium]